jgi:hypothetical protein
VKEIASGGFHYNKKLSEAFLPSLAVANEHALSCCAFNVIICPNLLTLGGSFVFYNNPMVFFSAMRLRNFTDFCLGGCDELITVIAPDAVADAGAMVFYDSPNVECLFAPKIGDFTCSCKKDGYNCIKCNGKLPQCLQRGVDFSSTQAGQEELAANKFGFNKEGMKEL